MRKLRILSALLILTFLLQDFAQAQGSVPLWSTVTEASPKNNNFAKDRLNSIAIPNESGITRKVVTQDTQKDIIINIQDAHSKLGAQESIANILDNLVKNYNLKLIALEGGSGLIDTSIIQSFPIQEVKHKTATYLMKEGMISAGEFYSMISNDPIKLYGVEDPELYQENLEVFKNIIENKLNIRRELKGLKKTIHELESKVYSRELLELTSHRLLHKDGSIKFTQYWDYFTKLAKENGIGYTQYPNLKKLSDVVNLEKDIDFKKAGIERDTLIQDLNQRLEKQDLEKLVLEALQYKQNKLSPGKFHRTLAELSQKVKINPLNYKNIILYSQYVILYESIDLIAIFDESTSFENDIREKLFRNQDERVLADLTHCVSIFSQLLDTTLNSKDYNFFVKNEATCQISEMKLLFQALGEKHKVPYTTYTDFNLLERAIPDAKKFYELATKRNQSLMDNTLRRMKKEGVHVAALVTGGFHSEGISTLLDQEKLSYLVVMPKFDEKSPDRPYITILTKKPKEYEEQFRDSEFYLAGEIATMVFGSLPDEQLRQLVEQRLSRLFIEAKSILQNGKLPEEIIKESVRNYELAAARLAKDGKRPFLSVAEYEGMLRQGRVTATRDKTYRVSFSPEEDDRLIFETTPARLAVTKKSTEPNKADLKKEAIAKAVAALEKFVSPETVYKKAGNFENRATRLLNDLKAAEEGETFQENLKNTGVSTALQKEWAEKIHQKRIPYLQDEINRSLLKRLDKILEKKYSTLRDFTEELHSLRRLAYSLSKPKFLADPTNKDLREKVIQKIQSLRQKDLESRLILKPEPLSIGEAVEIDNVFTKMALPEVLDIAPAVEETKPRQSWMQSLRSVFVRFVSRISRIGSISTRRQIGTIRPRPLAVDLVAPRVEVVEPKLALTDPLIAQAVVSDAPQIRQEKIVELRAALEAPDLNPRIERTVRIMGGSFKGDFSESNPAYLSAVGAIIDAASKAPYEGVDDLLDLLAQGVVVHQPEAVGPGGWPLWMTVSLLDQQLEYNRQHPADSWPSDGEFFTAMTATGPVVVHRSAKWLGGGLPEKTITDSGPALPAFVPDANRLMQAFPNMAPQADSADDLGFDPEGLSAQKQQDILIDAQNLKEWVDQSIETLKKSPTVSEVLDPALEVIRQIQEYLRNSAEQREFANDFDEWAKQADQTIDFIRSQPDGQRVLALAALEAAKKQLEFGIEAVQKDENGVAEKTLIFIALAQMLASWKIKAQERQSTDEDLSAAARLARRYSRRVILGFGVVAALGLSGGKGLVLAEGTIQEQFKKLEKISKPEDRIRWLQEQIEYISKTHIPSKTKERDAAINEFTRSVVSLQGSKGIEAISTRGQYDPAKHKPFLEQQAALQKTAQRLAEQIRYSYEYLDRLERELKLEQVLEALYSLDEDSKGLVTDKFFSQIQEVKEARENQEGSEASIRQAIQPLVDLHADQEAIFRRMMIGIKTGLPFEGGVGPQLDLQALFKNKNRGGPYKYAVVTIDESAKNDDDLVRVLGFNEGALPKEYQAFAREIDDVSTFWKQVPPNAEDLKRGKRVYITTFVEAMTYTEASYRPISAFISPRGASRDKVEQLILQDKLRFFPISYYRIGPKTAEVLKAKNPELGRVSLGPDGQYYFKGSAGDIASVVAPLLPRLSPEDKQKEIFYLAAIRNSKGDLLDFGLHLPISFRSGSGDLGISSVSRFVVDGSDSSRVLAKTTGDLVVSLYDSQKGPIFGSLTERQILTIQNLHRALFYGGAIAPKENAKPLDPPEVVVGDDAAKSGYRLSADTALKLWEATEALIKKLKESADPQKKNEIYRQIEENTLLLGATKRAGRFQVPEKPDGYVVPGVSQAVDKLEERGGAIFNAPTISILSFPQRLKEIVPVVPDGARLTEQVFKLRVAIVAPNQASFEAARNQLTSLLAKTLEIPTETVGARFSFMKTESAALFASRAPSGNSVVVDASEITPELAARLAPAYQDQFQTWKAGLSAFEVIVGTLERNPQGIEPVSLSELRAWMSVLGTAMQRPTSVTRGLQFVNGSRRQIFESNGNVIDAENKIAQALIRAYEKPKDARHLLWAAEALADYSQRTDRDASSLSQRIREALQKKYNEELAGLALEDGQYVVVLHESSIHVEGISPEEILKAAQSQIRVITEQVRRQTGGKSVRIRFLFAATSELTRRLVRAQGGFEEVVLLKPSQEGKAEKLDRILGAFTRPVQGRYTVVARKGAVEAARVLADNEFLMNIIPVQSNSFGGTMVAAFGLAVRGREVALPGLTHLEGNIFNYKPFLALISELLEQVRTVQQAVGTMA